MFAKRISPSWLFVARLDTGFYNPHAITIIEKIKSGTFETFGSSGEVWGFGAYELCNEIQESDEKNNPGFIKIGDLDPPFINVDDVLSVTPETHKLLAAAHVKPGDLLVSIAGTIGSVAIIPETNRKLSGNQATLKYRASPEKFDAYYVAAYTLSSMFKLITAKEAGGAVQKNLYLHNFLTIPIPKPQMVVQTYIGNKVREAELLREWAKKLESRADQIIQSEFIWQSVSTMTAKPRRIASRFVSEISLGPEFNRASEGQSLFENCSELSRVIKSCKCGDPIRADERRVGEYDYYGASGPIDKHDSYNFDGTFIIVAQDGSIGCASVSKGKVWANNHVWVLAVNEDSDADCIARYLNYHFPYWKGVTTGSVIPKVTAENLLNLKIPIKVARNVEAGNLLRLTSSARLLAGSLTEASKLLVESMIEGKISEAELIATQQSLENEDNTKEKAILRKLTDKGYAVKGGKPLFSNLDVLYELLNEAEKTQQEKDQA